MKMSLPQLPPLDSVNFLPTKKIRLCIAGMAGAGTFGHIWDVPGVSDVLVGCHMPYAKEEIDNFLGFAPDGYANEGAAMDFAMDAFYRAYQYGGAAAIGIGVCAVTASHTAHKGDHRIFVATF
jgi:nicotinamide mononucleotide (NMN) deamidase PncC